MLKDLLKDAVAGDPITGRKWTHRHKSTHILSQMLKARGIQASYHTIGRILREHNFSLKTNRKNLAHVSDPDRDQQFKYLSRIRELYQSLGFPALSVDSKKKELIGNFKNPGRTWRQKPKEVWDHDFPSWADGRAIPYCLYDIARNEGHVAIGISHETGAFAVNSIRKWWKTHGQKYYPGAKRILIQADSGGANGNRKWEWKIELQKFANEFQMIVVVQHYPSGASKWNLVEHQMLNLISANWAGMPLKDYATVLTYIRNTRSNSGFRCFAWLDKKLYPTKLKFSKEQKDAVQIKRKNILPRWNYEIRPQIKK